jgi:predicted nucleotidyltransferase
MNAQVVNLAIPYPQIHAFCERYHVRRLALFGSVLRRDFRPDSDVDVLVEFDPADVPGFFRFVAMQDELSDLFARRVDLNTPQSLSRHFRQKVLQTAMAVYERAG